MGVGEMIAEAPRRGGMCLPEITIRIRTRDRSSQIYLPPVVQIATASAVIAVAVALSYFGLNRIGSERAVAAKKAAMIERMTHTLDRALSERDRLRARVAELELDVGHRQKSAGLLRPAGLILTDADQPEVGQSPPERLISDAPPEPEDHTHNVAQFARQAAVEARRLLASTGLNVDRLFPQLTQDRGQGGPFVPPPRGAQPNELTQDGIEKLRSLIKSLPLLVPLDYFQLESRFGPRHDPFNHRSSFHTGIDLSAPYMAPVHTTAAGIVTYAGYLSDYGKVVEIDHGNGIATVYGHLHRFIVSVGQRVAEREHIGFLGSSGRSSGPHVHYEVRVNDEPQDPEKFIALARVLPVADR
jgi:murein DD-endopeptidase MepM/ murein hydrolase activator NlpD